MLKWKWNLGRVTGKTEPTEKFRKLNRQKIHVFSFPSVDGISASAIMKKMKNAFHFVNIDPTEKFQITDPPQKFGFLVFCQRKQNIRVDHYAISLILIIRKKFESPIPQSLGLWFSFLSVDGNGISLENQRCKFSFFLNFPLVHFSPSPFLGSISTFLHGYTENIYAWTFMRGGLSTPRVTYV